MLDTEKTFCPYCGEPIKLVLDTSVPDQEYTEDCFVCCRPMVVVMSQSLDGMFLSVRREDEV